MNAFQDQSKSPAIHWFPSWKHRWDRGADDLRGVQDMEEECTLFLWYSLLSCADLANSDMRVDAIQKRVCLNYHDIYRPPGSDSSVQKLLIGTHTSNDEQNYIQIMQVKIPLESSKDVKDQPEPPRAPVGTQADLTAQGGVAIPKHEKITIETQINH